VLTTQDGGKINEVLISYDAVSKVMKYEITESVLPVREYGATLKIKESADGKTTVVWSANFKRKDPANPGAAGQDDAAAKAAILGIFKSGLENIKKISE
jgi:mxaD protein